MARHAKFQLVWIWLTLFQLDITAFCATAEVDEAKSTEKVNAKDIVLKSCCSSSAAYSSLNSNENNPSCQNENFVVSWDILKRYRVASGSDTSVPVPEANTLSETSPKTQLNCEDTVSLTIPVWEESGNTPSKGFSVSFYPDGHLQFDKYLYSSEDFCIDSLTSKVITVLACNYSARCQNPEDTATCIARCCNYGQVWDLSSPFFVVPIQDVSAGIQKYIQIWNKFRHPPEFKILQNGTVWMKLRKREWVQLQPGEYCIDGFQFGKGNFSGDNADALIFECKELETTEEIEGKERQRKFSIGFGIILMFCLVFLLMTAIVYVLLWSKHNIHGWTVFCYILALLFTYLLLGASHFASVSLVREQEKYGSVGIVTFCGIIGVLCHFAFLSTFSWSTVLNFDLWCTFRNLRPASGKSSGRKKFLLYCLFVLAVPTTIVTVGIILDFKYRNDVHSDVISPEYGKSVCYVEPRHARFFFVILPIAALLGINMTLFCNTAYSLYKVKKSTQFASSSSTRNEAGNQTFRIILKLLLINGTIWIAEIISWYLQTDYEEVETISFILDVVNVLQAVAIFFLFVFKNDILEALKKSYPCLAGVVNAAFKLKTFFRKNHPQGPATANTSTVSSRTVEMNNMAVAKL